MLTSVACRNALLTGILPIRRYNLKVHKKIAIAILLTAVAVAGYILYPREFKVREDEIALRIQMDTKEDIGLLVYDYNIAGHDYSGGISNADRSLIGHDEELIVTWNDEELKIKTEEDIPFKITTFSV